MVRGATPLICLIGHTGPTGGGGLIGPIKVSPRPDEPQQGGVGLGHGETARHRAVYPLMPTEVHYETYLLAGQARLVHPDQVMAR